MMAGEDDVTLDLLMAQLVGAAGWSQFIGAVLSKQQQANAKLLRAQPDDRPEAIHRLLGEITAYGYVLGMPQALAQDAVKAREEDAAKRSATRPRQGPTTSRRS